jgi:hypothetical protein
MGQGLNHANKNKPRNFLYSFLEENVSFCFGIINIPANYLGESHSTVNNSAMEQNRHLKLARNT